MGGAHLIGDYHLRTVYNDDGYSTVDDYARRAKDLNYTEIAITDLCKKDGDIGQHFKHLRHIPDMLYGVRILKGIETNILPSGSVTTPFEVLEQLDWVVASIHKDEDYRIDLDYTRIIDKIVSQERFNVKAIGHLHTILDNEDTEAIVKTCKYSGVLIEIADWEVKGNEEALEELIRMCKYQGAPVVLTSNSHHCSEMGDFQHVIPFLQKLRFPLSLVYNMSSYSGASKLLP